MEGQDGLQGLEGLDALSSKIAEVYNDSNISLARAEKSLQMTKKCLGKVETANRILKTTLKRVSLISGSRAPWKGGQPSPPVNKSTGS